MSHKLVASDVECPDNRLLWIQRFRDPPVLFVLFLLGRKDFFAQQKTFRSVQTYSVRSLHFYKFKLLFELDIRRKLDTMSVEGFGRLIPQRRQCLFEPFIFQPFLFEMFECLFRRVQHNNAVKAVDNNSIFRLHHGIDLVYADDCGNF